MNYKVGDKIVPKDGEWTCGNAEDAMADYAVITEVRNYYESNYYGYDLYKDGKIVSNCFRCQDDTNSRLMEKTMEDLQKGDVIVGKSGTERTVIERLGDIIFTTGYNNDCTATTVWNITELTNTGFTIKQPEPTELTMREVADRLGVDVSKLKIKKG